MGVRGPSQAHSAGPEALDVELLSVPPRKKSWAQQRKPGVLHIVCDCRAAYSGKGEVCAAPPGTAAAPGADPCSYYSQRRLYTFEEAPPVLQYNKFIRTGYRAGLSYPQCLCSMFQLHNETGNILTHFLPALLLLGLLARELLAPWPHARLEFWQNVGSILLCFCLSVAYHTFQANHHDYYTWLKLDVCGVLLVLVGGGHMVLWWGFHCHPALRVLFSLTYYAAGAACVYSAVAARSSLGRVAPMAALLLLRLVSFVVRLAVAQHPTPALWHYFAMEAYSLLGGALNALRIPERWLQPRDPAHPGPLDYWFNSHQLMHVCVALAMLHLHLGAAQDYHTVMSLKSGELQCAAAALAVV